MFPDLLRIHYLVVLADDALEDASPFQGFGPSWPDLIWAFELLAQLPADVLEPSHPIEGVIAPRNLFHSFVFASIRGDIDEGMT